MKKDTVLDLFSGCGGLSHGFSKAGYRVLAGMDNWDISLQTFKKNHPSAKTVTADISKLSPLEAAKKLGLKKNGIGIIVGGPPCQGFSLSGKRDVNDPRNLLYKGFVEYVNFFRPTAFLMENVPNILSMDNGAVRDKILSDFEALGYTVSYKILLASDYGVPQNRRRAFFIGLKNGKVFNFPSPMYGEKDGLMKKLTTKDAISDLPNRDLTDGQRYTTPAVSDYQKKMRVGSRGVYNHQAVVHTEKTKSIISLVPDGGNYKNLPKALQNTRKVNIAWTRFSSSKPGYTIDTGHNHHFHYKYNRVPTARESARIQSFEDNFYFCGTKGEQLKQIGNAVPPLLAYQVAKQLKKYL